MSITEITEKKHLFENAKNQWDLDTKLKPYFGKRRHEPALRPNTPPGTVGIYDFRKRLYEPALLPNTPPGTVGIYDFGK